MYRYISQQPSVIDAKGTKNFHAENIHLENVPQTMGMFDLKDATGVDLKDIVGSYSTTSPTLPTPSTISTSTVPVYNILSDNNLSVYFNISELTLFREPSFQILFGITLFLSFALKWFSKKFD